MVSEIQEKKSFSVFSIMQRLLLFTLFYIVAFSLLFPQLSCAGATSPFKKVKKLILGYTFNYLLSCLICVGPSSSRLVKAVSCPL